MMSAPKTDWAAACICAVPLPGNRKLSPRHSAHFGIRQQSRSNNRSTHCFIHNVLHNRPAARCLAILDGGRRFPAMRTSLWKHCTFVTRHSVANNPTTATSSSSPGRWRNTASPQRAGAVQIDHIALRTARSSLLTERHRRKRTSSRGVEDMTGKRFGKSFPSGAGRSLTSFVVEGQLPPTGRKRLMSFFSTVFDFLTSLPREAVANKFYQRVAWPTFIATLIGTSAVWFQQEMGYEGIDTVAHETLGGIVGLLVAFRTNLAYDRWLQGRQALGSVTLHTLDIAAKMAAYLSDDISNVEAGSCRRESARLLRLLFSTTIIAVKEATAQVDELSPESGQLLLQIKDAAYVDATFLEQRQLAQSVRPPFMVLAWLRQHLQNKGTIAALSDDARAGLRDASALVLTQNGTGTEDLTNITMSRVFLVERWNDLMVSVNELTLSLGQCMSIASTPMPWQYGSINNILLALLVYTFPFALVGSLGFNVIPVSALLAFGYYGMDALSLELRTPYGNTGGTNFIINQDWLTDVHGEINTALLSTCPANPALTEADGTTYKYLQQSQTLYGRDTATLRDALPGNTMGPADQSPQDT